MARIETVIGGYRGNIKTMVQASDARTAVEQLDVAEEIPLFYRIPDHRLDKKTGKFKRQLIDGVELIEAEGNVKGHKGILNCSTGRVAAVVSDRYETLQHGDAFRLVLDRVDKIAGEQKEDTAFAIENDGNVARMEVLFPNIVIKDNTKEGILLGLRFRNSYDRSSSFTGEFFGYRVVCSNGAYMSRILGKMDVNIRHVDGVFEEVTKSLDEFILHILQDAKSTLEPQIQKAIKSKVVFESTEQIELTLKPIVYTQKAASAIAEKLPLKTDRWAIYQAITEYTSHTDITHLNRDFMVSQAERGVLIPEQLVPAIVPVAAA